MSALRYVVVTGVSSGIGEGIAGALVSRNCVVFGSVRRKEDADRLAKRFGKDAFIPLLLDVTDGAAIDCAIATVSDRLGASNRLFGLVNNAGISLPGPVQLQPIEEIRQQIDVLLVAPILVTRAFLPLLGADPARRRSGEHSRIVNIGSIGGRTNPPFLAVYGGAKAGLAIFSDGLRRELSPFGIDVVVIDPSSTRSAIWDKTDAKLAGYSSTAYGPMIAGYRRAVREEERHGMPAEQMGAAVADALLARRPATRRLVSPRPWMDHVPELLPTRWVDRIVARRLGQKRI